MTRRPLIPGTAIGFVFGLLAVTIALACSPAEPAIELSSPQAFRSPMILNAGSVFLDIVNQGGADTLVGASVDLPGTIAELHDLEDGRMIKTGQVPIPAHDTVKLRPGSRHIMIFNMPKDGPQDTCTLSLNFKKSGKKTIVLKFTNHLPSGT